MNKLLVVFLLFLCCEGSLAQTELINNNNNNNNNNKLRESLGQILVSVREVSGTTTVLVLLAAVSFFLISFSLTPPSKLTMFRMFFRGMGRWPSKSMEIFLMAVPVYVVGIFALASGLQSGSMSRDTFCVIVLVFASLAFELAMQLPAPARGLLVTDKGKSLPTAETDAEALVVPTGECVGEELRISAKRAGRYLSEMKSSCDLDALQLSRLTGLDPQDSENQLIDLRDMRVSSGSSELPVVSHIVQLLMFYSNAGGMVTVHGINNVFFSETMGLRAWKDSSAVAKRMCEISDKEKMLDVCADKVPAGVEAPVSMDSIEAIGTAFQS